MTKEQVSQYNKEYRLNNKEHLQEHYREYRIENRERIRQQVRDWHLIPENREKRRVWNSTFEKDPIKVKARMTLTNAVSSSKVSKMPCEVCGDENVHGHHSDYSKPLEVRWLCPIHHEALHHGLKDKLL